MADFLKENKDKLKADVILISDTGIINNETPCITNGLRAVCAIWKWKSLDRTAICIRIYGGGVDNPLNYSKLIGSLKDDNGHITVEDFYGDVIELTDEEKTNQCRSDYRNRI